ncbi:hypothetical protein [Halomonas elongata]|uniref:hypothetical protein n=1 Tax=Halomonas elongata TaxID=2746 RepID=UPI0023B17B50|nr:hypothetical protein [Halomonas elongata]
MLITTMDNIFLARLELHRHVRYLHAAGQVEAASELGQAVHQLGQQLMEVERVVKKHRLDSHYLGPLRPASEDVH